MANPLQKVIDKLGLVLKLMSANSTDNQLTVNILKGAQKDIDEVIKQIEKGAGN